MQIDLQPLAVMIHFTTKSEVTWSLSMEREAKRTVTTFAVVMASIVLFLVLLWLWLWLGKWDL